MDVIIVGLCNEIRTVGLPDTLQLYYGVHLRVLCAQLYCVVALFLKMKFRKQTNHKRLFACLAQQEKKVIRNFGKRMSYQLRFRIVSVIMYYALCVLSASIRFRCVTKTEWDVENFHIYRIFSNLIRTLFTVSEG